MDWGKNFCLGLPWLALMSLDWVCKWLGGRGPPEKGQAAGETISEWVSERAGEWETDARAILPEAADV